MVELYQDNTQEEHHKPSFIALENANIFSASEYIKPEYCKLIISLWYSKVESFPQPA